MTTLSCYSTWIAKCSLRLNAHYSLAGRAALSFGIGTEVQRVSFVGYTGGEGGSPRLWNLQNLHAVSYLRKSMMAK